jgi:hypothetical protein
MSDWRHAVSRDKAEKIQCEMEQPAVPESKKVLILNY